MDSWAQLADDEIAAVLDGMPGGVHGYVRGWGWMTFARAIEEASRRKNAPNAPLRADVRTALEEVRAVLHDHACHTDAFADRITRLIESLSPSHAQGGSEA